MTRASLVMTPFQHANLMLRNGEWEQALSEYSALWGSASYLRDMISWNMNYLLKKAPVDAVSSENRRAAIKLLEKVNSGSVSRIVGQQKKIKRNDPEKILDEYVKRRIAEKTLSEIPDDHIVLYLANEMAADIGYEAAYLYAKKYLPKNLQYTLHVLQATAAAQVGDEVAWLNNINNYLSHFNITPIFLEQGTGSVFSRLACNPERYINDGPMISVLMPAFNAGKSIRMAVNSILNQTWRNLELLIVDDCSEDDTWQQLQNMAAIDSRIKIFRNVVNVGPYISKNIAVSQAKGEWITGHDADDWAHPERLERQWRYCKENNQFACMSGMFRLNEDGVFTQIGDLGNKFYYDGVCRSGFITLMINSQYFHDVLGAWDNVRVAGDSEILQRIQAIEKKEIQQYPCITMLCLDNPMGLTKHPVLGQFNDIGMSIYRKKYKRNFVEWHKSMNDISSRLDFFPKKRPFPAPVEMLNSSVIIRRLFKDLQDKNVDIKKTLECDIAIITNFRFPGGNLSSTLDEVQFFIRNGFSVILVHCPTDGNLGKNISERANEFRDLIVNWSHISSLHANILICRSPAALVSRSFSLLAPKLSSRKTFVVKNNSKFRSTGELIYDFNDLLGNIRQIRTDVVEYCPIGPLMRDELLEYKSRIPDIKISDIDWTPTFDVELYKLSPKCNFSYPLRIGRHGRDGTEKWIGDKNLLLKVYPSNNDFKICILGGARNAKKILGKLPKNWSVYDFGSISPKDYLRELDVFVYFPSDGLIEAFGRTIIEAMIAGVPVILPPNFSDTFGELPLYCQPAKVELLIHHLVTSDPSQRIRYLTEIQEIASKRYSSRVITQRLAHTGFCDFISYQVAEISTLSKESLAYRTSLLEISLSS